MYLEIVPPLNPRTYSLRPNPCSCLCSSDRSKSLPVRAGEHTHREEVLRGEAGCRPVAEVVMPAPRAREPGFMPETLALCFSKATLSSHWPLPLGRGCDYLLEIL